MTLRATFALILVLLSVNAQAAPTPGSQVDAAVTAMTNAASRTFGKSVAWCDANQRPAGAPMDVRLKSYLAGMSSGTRQAMLEIAAKDPDFVHDTPVFDKKDLEMIDRQADAMLQNTKTTPGICAKLATVLDAGTPAFFKDSTRHGYQEYLAKRAAYCARQPKPANCK